MALKKINRTVQSPLVAEFTMLIGADSVVDINGVTKNFKDAAPVFEPIGLPPGAVLTGGDMTVEVASDDTGTATLAIGDSVSATRYLAATNIKALARTALTLTGYRSLGENLRFTLANANGNATVGTVTVRVQYIVTGRATEVQIT